MNRKAVMKDDKFLLTTFILFLHFMKEFQILVKVKVTIKYFIYFNPILIKGSEIVDQLEGQRKQTRAWVKVSWLRCSYGVRCCTVLYCSCTVLRGAMRCCAVLYCSCTVLHGVVLYGVADVTRRRPSWTASRTTGT